MLCLSKASLEKTTITFLNVSGSQELFEIWKSFKTFDHEDKKKFSNRVVHYLK